MKRTRVTLADVAREAGVSPMTVSRVLNRKGQASAETRGRVLRIVDRLGYRPNSVARGLATRRTRTVGVMVPDVANPFFPEIVRGAEDVAWSEGYTIVLCSSGESDAREAAILERFEASRVDGIILVSARMPDEPFLSFVRRHPAAVLVNRRAPGTLAASIEVDDAHGARIATRHLLATRPGDPIGVLRGPDRSYSARRRLEGHRAALAEAGRAFDEDRVEAAHPDVGGGRAAARALLERRPDVRAFLCHNDLVAVGALQACHERGLRIPEDVAVIGADDIQPAGLIRPTLTTLRSAKGALGRLAMRQLLALSEGGEPPDLALLRPELVLRESAPGGAPTPPGER